MRYCLLAAASVGLCAPTVHAEATDGLIDVLTGQPALRAPGAFDVRLTLEANLESDLVGVPTSLAPDVWWGVLPRLTIGLVHSDASVDDATTTASFCVRESSVCDRRYRGSGLDALYRVLDGPIEISPRVRVLLRDIDPLKPAVAFGAAVRGTYGRLSLTIDPYLRAPLANGPLGNRFAVNLPVWLGVEPRDGWQLALFTGYNADLVVFRDDGRIPVLIETAVRVVPEVAFGVEAGWPELFGPQHDARHGTLMITTDWRP